MDTRETVAPRWRAVAAAEVVAATALVLLDVAVPTLVVLLLGLLLLALRRRRPSGWGLTRLATPGRTVVVVAALTLGWTVLQFGLTMPLLNRATGHRQDMGTFADLEGDVGLLVTLLALSWTLAAFAEELVFRGYLPTRIEELLGGGRLAVAAGVLGSSVLFAAIHSEQGQVGVALTFLDALFFSYLRLRHGGVWASVVGHGTSNTIGLTTFFLVGPVYGLW